MYMVSTRAKSVELCIIYRHPYMQISRDDNNSSSINLIFKIKFCCIYYTMTCYICFEDTDAQPSTSECACKGSVSVHRECFQKWIKTATNPFQCCVCKTDYTVSFLKNFFSEHEILLHSADSDEEEFEEIHLRIVSVPGLPDVIISPANEVIFSKPVHRKLYKECIDKNVFAVKQESRNRQKKSIREIKKISIRNRTKCRF